MMCLGAQDVASEYAAAALHELVLVKHDKLLMQEQMAELPDFRVNYLPIQRKTCDQKCT